MTQWVENQYSGLLPTKKRNLNRIQHIEYNTHGNDKYCLLFHELLCIIYFIHTHAHTHWILIKRYFLVGGVGHSQNKIEK